MKKLLLLSITLFSACSIFSQEIKLPEKPKTSNHKDYRQEVAGFWSSAELDLGSSVMFKKKNLQNIGISYTGGFRFNEFLKVGVGVGVKYYYNNNEVRHSDIKWTFPIYANVRGNIISQNNRSCVPYWGIKLGTVIRDGFFFSPTLGVRLGEHRDSWLLNISYSYNKLEVLPDVNTDCNFLLLGVGYEF